MTNDTIPTQRRPIGFWLRLVDGLIEDRLTQSLKADGIRRVQWQTLNAIHAGASNRTQVEDRLRPFLSGENGEVTSIVRPLLDRGWLSEQAGELRLTEVGSQRFEALLSQISEDRRRLIDGVDESEYVTTVTTLEHMARNLGWSGSGESAPVQDG